MRDMAGAVSNIANKEEIGEGTKNRETECKIVKLKFNDLS